MNKNSNLWFIYGSVSFVILKLLLSLVITPTTSNAENKSSEVVSENSVEVEGEYRDFNLKPQEFVDDETGVHYLVFTRNGKLAITVRYNADGTIMVDEKEGE